MASDAEIREAEQAVIDAVLIDAEVIDEENHRALRRAALALKALKSPLPSRAEMARRGLAVASGQDGSRGARVEQHWADALRWVAREMRVTNEAGAIYNMMPGSPSYQSAFEGAQKQLRAWADELEARE